MTKKPSPIWEVIKATGGVTFIRKGSQRFDLHFDDGEAQRIADKLNELERKLEKAKTRAGKLITPPPRLSKRTL